MNHNHCAEFISLLNHSIKANSNIIYQNRNIIELQSCHDYDELIKKLEKQKINIKVSNILPKTEIGINFNPETKMLLVFPTNNFKVSEK